MTISESSIRPLENFIFIKREEEEEELNVGGIKLAIPDSAKEKHNRGIVISVGNGKKIQELNLKPGMRILFSKYGGTDLELGNQKYIILKNDDIMAIIE